MRKIDTSISITGGEPTVDPKLPIILDKVGLLLPSTNNETILDKLVRNGFNHLNISKVSYDEEVNQKIMKFKRKSETTTNEMLEEIVAKAKLGGIRPRMSCLVNKEAVSNLANVISYIEFYKSIGVDNIVFRELMNYDFEKAECNGSVINRVKRDFYKNNFIDLKYILSDINKDERFTLLNKVSGYYYDVWVFDYNGVSCCFEKANLENMSNKGNTIYEFVLHPNGRLCGSWNDKEDVIIDFNSERGLL